MLVNFLKSFAVYPDSSEAPVWRRIKELRPLQSFPPEFHKAPFDRITELANKDHAAIIQNRKNAYGTLVADEFPLGFMSIRELDPIPIDFQ